MEEEFNYATPSEEIRRLMETTDNPVTKASYKQILENREKREQLKRRNEE